MSDSHANAVGMQVHVTGLARQLQREKALSLVRLPIPQATATRSATDSNDEASWVKSDAAHYARKVFRRAQKCLARTRMPVEEHAYRLADPGKSVGYVCDPRTSQQPAVPAKRHAAHTPTVRPKALVVLPEY